MTPREAHHNSHSRPLLPQGLRQNCDTLAGTCSKFLDERFATRREVALRRKVALTRSYRVTLQCAAQIHTVCDKCCALHGHPVSPAWCAANVQKMPTRPLSEIGRSAV